MSTGAGRVSDALSGPRRFVGLAALLSSITAGCVTGDPEPLYRADPLCFDDPNRLTACPVERVYPDYPEEPYGHRAEGLVRLAYRVGPDGRTRDIEVESALGHPSFVDAALAAVRTWRFEPAMRDGQPIASRQIGIQFPFELNATPNLPGEEFSLDLAAALIAIKNEDWATAEARLARLDALPWPKLEEAIRAELVRNILEIATRDPDHGAQRLMATIGTLRRFISPAEKAVALEWTARSRFAIDDLGLARSASVELVQLLLEQGEAPPRDVATYPASLAALRDGPHPLIREASLRPARPGNAVGHLSHHPLRRRVVIEVLEGPAPELLRMRCKDAPNDYEVLDGRSLLGGVIEVRGDNGFCGLDIAGWPTTRVRITELPEEPPAE